MPNPFQLQRVIYPGVPRGADAVLPGVPQNLQATAGDREVSLTWDASSGATEYDLYRGLINDFEDSPTLIQSAIATTTAEDASPLPGWLYHYWIVAKNGVGSSEESTSASARPHITLPHSESANLSVPDGAVMNLEDLFFGSTQPPPVGLVVDFSGGQYSPVGGGNWEDINTADPANTVPISGTFSILNSSGSPYTFWDSEP